MSQPSDLQAWWNLHLRKARGEALSESEQRFYEAELTRQETTSPPLKSDLDGLKKMYAQIADLANANSKLRSRVTELEREIATVEQSLSPETREALGVKV